MRFILLIYENEAAEAARPEAELHQIFEEYSAVTEEMRQAGVLQSGAPLEPVRTAKSCRAKNGKAVVSDGPFAETKEQLGGFYVLDCKDEQEALRWAEKIPAARSGTVEVRPVMIMPGEEA